MNEEMRKYVIGQAQAIVSVNPHKTPEQAIAFVLDNLKKAAEERALFEAILDKQLGEES